MAKKADEEVGLEVHGMRKNWMILLCILSLMAFWAYPTIAAANDVTIDATDMEYDMEAKAVVATGNVVLHGDNLEIRADQLTYGDDGWVTVPGKAYIKNEQGEFIGDSLHYNVNTKTGELKNISGQENGYYFKGENGSVSPSEESIQKGTVTRCSLPNPDYRLHAARIRFSQGHLIVERGYIDVLGIPVLPVFYLNVDLDNMDNWPELHAGSDKERGVFVTALQHFTLSPQWAGYGEVGLGTNEWSRLGAGLTWTPTPGLSFSGSSSQEWSHADKELWRFAGNLDLWKSDGGQRIYLEGFREFQQAVDYKDTNNDLNHEEYHGYLSGLRVNFVPKTDLTLGVGYVDSIGDNRFYGDGGWGPEASIHWKQPLGDDWSFRIDSSYRWGGDDDRFLTKQIALTHYFHCIGTTIGWDGIEEKWQFSVSVRW